MPCINTRVSCCISCPCGFLLLSRRGVEIVTFMLIVQRGGMNTRARFFLHRQRALGSREVFMSVGEQNRLSCPLENEIELTFEGTEQRYNVFTV